MEKKSLVKKVLRRTVFALVFAAGLALAAGRISAAPVFNPDGSITNGNKSVSLGKTGWLILKTGEKELKFLVCFFKIDPVTKAQNYFATQSLTDKTLDVFQGNKEIRFKGTYTDPDSQKSMEFQISVSLDKDGLVTVQHKCSTGELFNSKILAGTEGWLYLDMDYAVFSGHTIRSDDRLIVLGQKEIKDGDKVIPIEPTDTAQRVLTISGAPEKLVLFADQPDTALTILTMKKESVLLVSDLSTKRHNLMVGLPSLVKIDLGK